MTCAEKDPASVCIEDAIPIIRAVATRMHKRLKVIDIDELISIGMSTLDDARRKYDPSRGHFHPYLINRLYWAMTSAARRLFRRYDPERGVPVGVAERYFDDNARPVRVSALHEEGHHPSILEFRNLPAGSVTAVGDLEDSAICSADDPERTIWRHRMVEILSRAVEGLSVIERTVIVQHYIFGMPFKAIAATLGKSQPHICRVHKRALQRLAELLRKAGFDADLCGGEP